MRIIAKIFNAVKDEITTYRAFRQLTPDQRKQLYRAPAKPARKPQRSQCIEYRLEIGGPWRLPILVEVG